MSTATAPPNQPTGAGVVEVDGHPVAVRSAGDGPGAPLLLVHGYSGHAGDFAEVLAGLSADRRVVAVDLPGHGGSPGPDDPSAYRLPALAAWVLRVADALGMDELHLLGHSHGGLVVQRVAAAASQRLRSLVLMSTGLGALREEVAERYVATARTAREEGMEAAYRRLVAPEPGEEPGDEDPDHRARFLALPPAAVEATTRNLVTAMPLGAFWRGIDVPVLVLHGADDDAWSPAEQALLARTVRGARLAVIPHAGHSPQQDQPEAWLASVRPFLAAADR